MTHEREAVVIMGTHGGLRVKPIDDSPYQARGTDCRFLYPVKWNDTRVQICGITMPLGGNVNFADDKRETQVLNAAKAQLMYAGSFFDNHNLKLRHLADDLLRSDKYLPLACSVGSQITDTDLLPALTPETHEGSTLEDDLDSAVSDIMEDRTALDAVKGCVLPNSDKLDERQIIANYVPVVYSNTGSIEHSADGPTKVPLCSKMFTLSEDEYRRGTGSHADQRPKAEWKVSLLFKDEHGNCHYDPQFAQKLYAEVPPRDIFGEEDEDKTQLRGDTTSRLFYTETLISLLIRMRFTKIIIVDVTCCVFRNSGYKRPGGHAFGDVCSKGVNDPAVERMLKRTVTPWIMLSQYGILETYDNRHVHPDHDYYRDRFRNATNEAVFHFIQNYYKYLQFAFECKQSAKKMLISDKLLKTKVDLTKVKCIIDFFECYKKKSSDTVGTAIHRPIDRARSLSYDRRDSSRRGSPPPGARRGSPPPGELDDYRLLRPSSRSPPPPRRGGKKTKTRQGKRNKSRNFRNKSISRRTRRRVIKRKNN